MRAALAIALLLLPCAAAAQEAPIRIWGTPALRGVAERWAEAWRREHPQARFEFRMAGSDSAIHALVGNADIALMGRENDLVDDAGFSRPREHAATRVEIATGSVAVPGKSEALALLVPVANPLTALTTAQLGRILACGNGQPIAMWGQLGLTGAWATRPIRIHAYDFATRTGRWLQDRVTGGDRRMCWDRISEYRNRHRLDGTLAPAAELAAAGGRADPDALVVADAAQAVDGLKLVALGDGTAAPVLPDAASVAARRYPLTRRAYAFVDRVPGKPLDPRVLGFLRFALSPAGQALLAEDRGYLPLAPAVAAAQIKILEQTQ